MTVYVLVRDCDGVVLGVWSTYAAARDTGDDYEREHGPEKGTCLVHSHDVRVVAGF